jgi:hypothetical protein
MTTTVPPARLQARLISRQVIRGAIAARGPAGFIVNSQIDGGRADTNYTGTSPIDGGNAESNFNGTVPIDGGNAETVFGGG